MYGDFLALTAEQKPLLFLSHRCYPLTDIISSQKQQQASAIRKGDPFEASLPSPSVCLPAVLGTCKFFVLLFGVWASLVLCCQDNSTTSLELLHHFSSPAPTMLLFNSSSPFYPHLKWSSVCKFSQPVIDTCPLPTFIMFPLIVLVIASSS